MRRHREVDSKYSEWGAPSGSRSSDGASLYQTSRSTVVTKRPSTANAMIGRPCVCTGVRARAYTLSYRTKCSSCSRCMIDPPTPGARGESTRLRWPCNKSHATEWPPHHRRVSARAKPIQTGHSRSRRWRPIPPCCVGSALPCASISRSERGIGQSRIPTTGGQG